MYYIPEEYGVEDYKKPVNMEEVDHLLENFCTVPSICNSTTLELVQLLMPNHDFPDDVEGAICLYGDLVSKLEEASDVLRENPSFNGTLY